MTLLEEINDAGLDMWIDWNVMTQQASSLSVPDPDDMGYRDAKKINATFLYTDLQDSSRLSDIDDRVVAASVLASYLKVIVRVMKAGDGHVRSFDGDRVMAIFTGPNKTDRAVRAALRIRWAVDIHLNEEMHTRFDALEGWNLKTMSGVATTDALLVRAGIRNNSDLLSIGLAPNLAAKLSDVRGLGYHRIAIGNGTHNSLSSGLLTGRDGRDMWSGLKSISLGGGSYTYRTTSYHMEVS